jgi:putative oxidoreductase
MEYMEGGKTMKRWLLWFLRGAMAILFVYAGIIKVVDPASLLGDIEGYRLLPYSWAWVMAFYLPWLEILAGLALLWPRWSRSAALLLSALMGVFLVALVSAWWRGLDIHCGCFGKSAESNRYIWWVTRDLILLTGLLVVVCMSAKSLPLFSSALSSSDKP